MALSIIKVDKWWVFDRDSNYSIPHIDADILATCSEIPTSPENFVEKNPNCDIYGLFNIMLPYETYGDKWEDSYFYGYVNAANVSEWPTKKKFWGERQFGKWVINADTWEEFVEKFKQGPPESEPRVHGQPR